MALQLLVKRREEEESGEAETRIQARVLPPTLLGLPGADLG